MLFPWCFISVPPRLNTVSNIDVFPRFCFKHSANTQLIKCRPFGMAANLTHDPKAWILRLTHQLFYKLDLYNVYIYYSMDCDTVFVFPKRRNRPLNYRWGGRVHGEPGGCQSQKNRAWWRPLYSGSGASSSGLTDESLAQRSTLLSAAIYVHRQACVRSRCPWARQWVARVGGGRGRRWEGDSRPRDERSGPKQTQISSALLRRQGAEHRVLVDATKPFKTTLQPGMYAPPPPFPIYPVTDTLFTLTLAHGDLIVAVHAASMAGHDPLT